MAQLPLSVLPAFVLSLTEHCALYCVMYVYLHTPSANPALHVHWYAPIEIDVSALESMHVAPFLHGLLAHSSTSTLHVPLRLATARLCATLHSVVY
jgi:hypothetical protein